MVSETSKTEYGQECSQPGRHRAYFCIGSTRRDSTQLEEEETEWGEEDGESHPGCIEEDFEDVTMDKAFRMPTKQTMATRVSSLSLPISFFTLPNLVRLSPHQCSCSPSISMHTYTRARTAPMLHPTPHRCGRRVG